mmetsp:Transcript_59731/g.142517  ORF Transcript_59731/g.142517 Transcript_59731/m.142517 type:complete len:218 (-) Transcript_59731:458-1111(-)
MRCWLHLALGLGMKLQAARQGCHTGLHSILLREILEDRFWALQEAADFFDAGLREFLGQSLHIRDRELLLGPGSDEAPHLVALPGRRPQGLVQHFFPWVHPPVPIGFENFAVWRRALVDCDVKGFAHGELFFEPSSFLDAARLVDTLPLQHRELVALWSRLLHLCCRDLIQVGHHLVRTKSLRQLHRVLVQKLHLGHMVDQAQPVVWLLCHRIVEEL